VRIVAASEDFEDRRTIREVLADGVNERARLRSEPTGQLWMPTRELQQADDVDAWTEQALAVAAATNCQKELTMRFSTFPPQGTVEAFVCEARFGMAWRILHASISGPVWAYMRVLGYAHGAPVPGSHEPSSRPQPTPAEALDFAKLAAQRMDSVGTEAQPQQERVNSECLLVLVVFVSVVFS